LVARAAPPGLGVRVGVVEKDQTASRGYSRTSTKSQITVTVTLRRPASAVIASI